MSQALVTITKHEYERLLYEAKSFQVLRDAGVDNWEGWDFAMTLMEENDD